MSLEVYTDAFIAIAKFQSQQKTFLSVDLCKFLLAAWHFGLSDTSFTFIPFSFCWIWSYGKGSLFSSSLTDAVSKG